MRFKTRTIALTAAIAGLLLCAPVTQADDDNLQSMKFAAHCKVEGAEAAKCTTARRELVKYSMHCKVEGADGKRCQQAGDVVKAQKLAEQPDVSGAAEANAKTMPATAAAPAAAKDDMDMKYALHCKAEGEDGKHCMGMRDKVGKYAAHCKEEGADGERCQTAHKVMSTLSGQ